MLPGRLRLLKKIVQVILVSRLVWLHVIVSFFNREIRNHVYRKHQIVPHDQVFPHSTSRAFLFASSVLGHLKKS